MVSVLDLRSTFAGTLLVTLVSVTAQAAEVTAPSWTGLFIGAEIGASPVISTLSMAPGGGDPQPTTSIGAAGNGPTLGVFAGYNYRLNSRFLLGMELEAERLQGANYAFIGASTVDFLEFSRWTGSLTGKVGVLVSPRTLVYGKIGPGLLSLDGYKDFGDKLADTFVELHAGVGVESKLTDQLSLRFEGSYTGGGRTLSLNDGTYNYRPQLLQSKLGLVWTPWPVAERDAVLTEVAAPNWTGIEVGGMVSLNQHYLSMIDSASNAPLFGQVPFAATSIGAVGFVGGNFQLPIPAVVGLEFNGSLQHGSFIDPSGAGGITGTYYTYATLNDIEALTARIGWLPSPDTLLYVKGGPARMHFETKGNYWTNVADNSTGSRYLRAWQVGGGVETFVVPHVSLRIEASYTRSDETVVLNGSNGPDEFTLRPSSYSIATGLAYHF
ncbi:MAG: outer membrane beta-barrel protein [Ancalomicrobiaceae bacterium]|nr:outer membrane beta-barrel protein [Ancalomicrobiaceae bacterium]